MVCAQNKMFKDKTTYLIGILVILLILVIVVQLQTSRAPQSIPQSIPPTPKVSESPLIQTKPLDSHQPQVEFKVIGSSLTETPIGITDGFTITFSKPLSYIDVNISLEPKIETEFALDSSGRMLTINPRIAWDFDTTYKLTVNAQTKSQSGENLDSPEEIIFKTSGYGGI